MLRGPLRCRHTEQAHGLQFAKAAGARVIVITSSAEKGQLLKSLGADHVLIIKKTPTRVKVL